MILTLIGMSNCGKTYWSKKLEGAGFKRFGCDDIIEKKLEVELKKLGYLGINDVAKWMGQPFDKQYPATSNKYLEFEKESLKGIIRTITKRKTHDNIVIDTTGSVIYTGKKIIEQLRKYSVVVYLDTPKLILKTMNELYFKNPKPVYWGDSYKHLNGESDIESLKRCYPYLLEFRDKNYRKYSHIILDYISHHDPSLTPADFLKIVTN